jgi:hypothetical protein
MILKGSKKVLNILKNKEFETFLVSFKLSK